MSKTSIKLGKKKNCISVREKREKRAYQALNIQNCCARINVFFCSNWTSRELNLEAFLKLQHMISYVSIQSRHLHEFVGINFSKPFNVNRPTLLVHTMITMWIVLKHFIQLSVLKVLLENRSKKKKIYNRLSMTKVNHKTEVLFPI